MNRTVRNRLFSALIFFAVLFSTVAFLQYRFVNSQLQRTAAAQLDDWADQLVEEVDYKGAWDLTGYRRANPDAPTFYIVTTQGLLLDVAGLEEESLPTVTLPANLIYDKPFDFISGVKEPWRLFAKKVKGGSVIVGVPVSEKEPDVDELLKANSETFGSTIATASEVKDRQLDLPIEYAVIDDSYRLRNAAGGIPISTSYEAIQNVLRHGPVLSFDSGTYFVSERLISDQANRTVAAIVLFKDVGLEQQMLHKSLLFNAGVAGACWIFCGVLASIYLFGHGGPRITCEEAIAQEEGQMIEFKGSLRWDHNLGRENRAALEPEVFKTVAAFLNTDGGVLMIGVSDDRQALGLEPDYRTLTKKPNKDGFLLTLQQVLSTALGVVDLARYLRIEFCRISDKDICVVYVKPARHEMFVREKGGKSFYVRVGNATRPLDPEETIAYIRSHWGA